MWRSRVGEGREVREGEAVAHCARAKDCIEILKLSALVTVLMIFSSKNMTTIKPQKLDQLITSSSFLTKGRFCDETRHKAFVIFLQSHCENLCECACVLERVRVFPHLNSHTSDVGISGQSLFRENLDVPAFLATSTDDVTRQIRLQRRKSDVDTRP